MCIIRPERQYLLGRKTAKAQLIIRKVGIEIPDARIETVLADLLQRAPKRLIEYGL